MSDPSALARSAEKVDEAIEKLKAKNPTEENRYRLLKLELRRDNLQARAFRALQKKIARMPK